MDKKKHIYDVVIIGAGIAGLNTARYINPKLRVALIVKDKLGDGASVMAQGGIASVSNKNEDDSFASHIDDTIRVGAGLCNKEVVKYCINNAPDAIKDLLDIGVDFSLRELGKTGYDLTKEGGHSHRRIYHSGDITGEAIVSGLVNDVKKRRNVDIFEHHTAINIIQTNDNAVSGIYILDEAKGVVKTFVSSVIILATGGAGKAYIYTSNPDTATGDGIAIAYRAGAEIANMEFYQFHPTCLYHPKAKNFLISEAVRGEGAYLRLKSGERFMEHYHKDMELAPRDVVARAIDTELKRSGSDCVYLDATHLDSDFVKNRFPNIYEKCLSYGFDMTKELIPVVPAAHYCCGGIKVDLDGRTNIKGLWGCGECTCTGLHGANRLASNSLLEAMVLSKRLAEKLSKEALKKSNSVPDWDDSWVRKPEEKVLIHNNWDELRMTMWNNVGIVRSVDRLKNALKRIEMIKIETEAFYWDYQLNRDLLELRNIVCVAELIVRSAMSRKESRGLHYIKNFPGKDENLNNDTVIVK